MNIKSIMKGKNLIITFLGLVIILLVITIFFISQLFLFGTISKGGPLTKIDNLTCKITHRNSFGKFVDFDSNTIQILGASGTIKEKFARYKPQDSNEWKEYRADIWRFSLKDNKIILNNELNSETFTIKENKKDKVVALSEAIGSHMNATAVSIKVLILDKNSGHMLINEAESYKVLQDDSLHTYSTLYLCNQ